LRSLILVKRHGGPVLKAFASPFLAVGRFFAQTFGVPIYRRVFWIRRYTSRLLIPAKQRIHFFISNRYAIHFAVIAIAALTGAMNIGGSEVRAETFGQNSMLYALVAQDENAAIEVVAASEIVDPHPVSYMTEPVIDATAHIDLNYIDTSYVTTMVGGSSVASPTITDNAENISERKEVIAYVVEEGDVLGNISQKFGLSLSSILWANNLSYRSTIRPGEELVIPPVDGVIYKVKSGDSLGRIAKAYSADADKIMAFNVLEDANDLVIGEKLILPGGEPPTPVVRRTAPVNQIFTAPSGSTTSSGSGVKEKGSETGRGSMLWPTNWRVITQYYGWHHTGLDIDGDYGTDSIASCSGSVIRSGWFSGYGITVEIACDGDWSGFTLRYAHHAKNYVGVGDYVTAGQSIAQTGTTGRSTGTHLHFEVIKSGKFQNPLDYVR
jgi:murein DD-endopeptidase MepM/ murein hydrolase activator NlpD